MIQMKIVTEMSAAEYLRRCKYWQQDTAGHGYCRIVGAAYKCDEGKQEQFRGCYLFNEQEH